MDILVQDKPDLQSQFQDNQGYGLPKTTQRNPVSKTIHISTLTEEELTIRHFLPSFQLTALNCDDLTQKGAKQKEITYNSSLLFSNPVFYLAWFVYLVRTHE